MLLFFHYIFLVNVGYVDVVRRNQFFFFEVKHEISHKQSKDKFVRLFLIIKEKKEEKRKKDVLETLT